MPPRPGAPGVSMPVSRNMRPRLSSPLPYLASTLGLGNIRAKDESKRFGLNAFKVLGASYAMGRYLAERLGNPLTI